MQINKIIGEVYNPILNLSETHSWKLYEKLLNKLTNAIFAKLPYAQINYG